MSVVIFGAIDEHFAALSHLLAFICLCDRIWFSSIGQHNGFPSTSVQGWQQAFLGWWLTLHEKVSFAWTSWKRWLTFIWCGQSRWWWVLFAGRCFCQHLHISPLAAAHHIYFLSMPSLCLFSNHILHYTITIQGFSWSLAKFSILYRYWIQIGLRRAIPNPESLVSSANSMVSSTYNH